MSTSKKHKFKLTPKLILASQSKARRLLMKKLGMPFRCVSSGYQENMEKFSSPKKLAPYLALGKAEFIAHKFPNSIIIGADTFITSGKQKIGKPGTMPRALKMIKAMSGKTIGVHSGVAVLKTDARGKIISRKIAYCVTKLKIKKMSTHEVRLLANQKDALKISGAFGIEGVGGKMVEKINGDYDNVIGLPLFLLKRMLKKMLA